MQAHTEFEKHNLITLLGIGNWILPCNSCNHSFIEDKKVLMNCYVLSLVLGSKDNEF